jgi:iron complex outermembrane recepter protein
MFIRKKITRKPQLALMFAAVASPALASPVFATPTEEVEVIRVIGDRRLQQPLSNIAGSMTIIDESAIAAQLAINLNTEQLLLNLVPGYNRNSFPTLRGRRALVLINGTPQNETLRESSGFDVENIDPTAIERIEVIRGASALYGYGAPGGIINIITRRASQPGTEHSVRLGYRVNPEAGFTSAAPSARYQVLGKQDDLDMALGLNYQRNQLPFDANGERIPDYSWDSRDAGADLTLGYQLDDLQSLLLRAAYQKRSIVKSYSAANGNYPVTASEAQHDAFADDGYLTDQLYSLSYQHKQLWQDTALAVDMYRQAHFDTELQDVGFAIVDDRLENSSYGVRTTFTTQLSPRNDGAVIYWGADYLRDAFSRPAVLPEDGTVVAYFAPPVHLDTFSGYVQGELPLGNWRLNAGVRHEIYLGAAAETSAVGNGGIVGGKVESDSLTLANFGVLYRFSDDNEWYVSLAQGTDITQLGRAARTANHVNQIRLEPDTSTQLESGYRHRYTQVEYSVSGFYSRSDKGVTLVPDPVDPERNPLMVRREPRRVWGLEATLEWELSLAHQLGANFSWQQGKVDEDKQGVWQPMPAYEISPARLAMHWQWQQTGSLQHRLQSRYSFKRDKFDAPPGEFGKGNVDSLFELDYLLSIQGSLGHWQLAVNNLLNEDDWDQNSQSYNYAGGATRIEGRTVSISYTLSW